MGEPVRVAVIGAGAGGLVACRWLADDDRFLATVFERSGVVGGTWNYDDRTGTDDDGLPVHSSMYRNLLTNLPKEAMGFLDYDFPEDVERSFVPHRVVLKYLRDYCHRFDLLRHIRFHSLVTGVSPVDAEGSTTWEVTSRDLCTGEMETATFDAVAICNGHYSVPTYPDVEGLSSFEGRLLHSHDYRVPDPFAGSIVAVLGAGPSGTDIAVEVATVAKEVLLCHGLPEKLTSPLPANLRQEPWVKSCDAGGIVLEDGRRLPVDALILCTGYEYAFPFLTPECGVVVSDRTVAPLYKHFLHVRRPSLALFGIPSGVVPFPLMDVQARIFCRVLLGALRLPSEADMREDARKEMEDFRESGGLPRRFHRMGCERFRRHVADLAPMAGLDRAPDHVHRLHELTWMGRKRNLVRYRDVDYAVRGPEVLQRE